MGYPTRQRPCFLSDWRSDCQFYSLLSGTEDQGGYLPWVYPNKSLVAFQTGSHGFTYNHQILCPFACIELHFKNVSLGLEDGSVVKVSFKWHELHMQNPLKGGRRTDCTKLSSDCYMCSCEHSNTSCACMCMHKYSLPCTQTVMRRIQNPNHHQETDSMQNQSLLRAMTRTAATLTAQNRARPGAQTRGGLYRGRGMGYSKSLGLWLAAP